MGHKYQLVHQLRLIMEARKQKQTHTLQHRTVLIKKGNQAENFHVLESCVMISNSHQLSLHKKE